MKATGAPLAGESTLAGISIEDHATCLVDREGCGVDISSCYAYSSASRLLLTTSGEREVTAGERKEEEKGERCVQNTEREWGGGIIKLEILRKRKRCMQGKRQRVGCC